ncbi:hypothetical protein B0T10DRAFT_479490 [Thelonectria olida]|uniref:Uncharacterized protein n=1 Tax=Thelonectria olida TaxID=1576542 RepID=A0A9P9AS48_9HYPO|nr:hypothetical protein B0T10DRAFT_479490 [Thelonectria olida]
MTTGSSAIESGSSLTTASSPYRNTTISEAAGVSAKTTTSGRAISTSYPAWNSTTTSCSSETNAVNSTSSCTLTQTPSTSCSDSVTIHPHATGAPATDSTSNCTETHPWTFRPPVPIPVTSICNSSSTTSTCNTSRWVNATAKSTSLQSMGNAQPTTLETVTTGDPGSNVAKSNYPSAAATGVDKLPDDPNFPWGGDSPIHRHGNVSELGAGSHKEPPSFSPPRRRWEQVVSKLRSLWRDNGSDDEEQV